MRDYRRSTWLHTLAIGCVSAGLFALSESNRYGDAPFYAQNIASRVVVEPGHLLWRPIGLALSWVLGLGNDADAVLWVLQGSSLAFAVGAVIALHRLCLRFATAHAAAAAAILLAVSNGFWSYAFSGCSYSLGVLLLVLSIHSAVRHESGLTRRRAFASAALLSLSALSWGAMVIAGPAVVALLFGDAALRNGNPRIWLSVGLSFAAAVALVFFLPLLVLHGSVSLIGPEHYYAPSPDALSVLSWLRSADHGVPLSFGLGQLFRVAVGFPQSIVSFSDLPQQLRLWMLGEHGRPALEWSFVLVAAYAVLALLPITAWRQWARLRYDARVVLAASAVALGVNWGFAVTWQGTDLERYFPSLPFFVLSGSILLSQYLRAERARRAGAFAWLLVVAVAASVGTGTILPSVHPAGYRQRWLQALRAHTEPSHVVFVFGNKKTQVTSPHDRRLPRLVNVSVLTQLYPQAWDSVVFAVVENTRLHGGAFFVSESLVREDANEREGWSFREHPRPSPAELRSAFLPLTSDSAIFSVDGERVFKGRAPRAAAGTGPH